MKGAWLLAVLVAGCAEPEDYAAPRMAVQPYYGALQPCCASPAPAPAFGASGAAVFGQGPGGAAYERGMASYYSDRLAHHRTSSGEPYEPGALTAAHRTLPFGTIVDVATSDGRHVAVRINDRGPYAAGRVIDLSRRAATELGIVRAGVADVVLRIVWLPPGASRLASLQ